MPRRSISCWCSPPMCRAASTMSNSTCSARAMPRRSQIHACCGQFRAVAAGITVNGLAIINTQANPGYAFHTQPPGGLPKYYEENVIGGPGAFLLQVENFDTFAESMTRKLVTEIAGGPAASDYAALQ